MPLTDAAKRKAHSEEFYLPSHVKHNVGVLFTFRNFVAIVAGVAVGIVGVAGWLGLLYHIATQFLCIVPYIVTSGGNVRMYFPTWNLFLFGNVFSSTAILSYILFWMIFYNLCHIF